MVLDILSSPQHVQMLEQYGELQQEDENPDDDEYEIFHEPANFRPRPANYDAPKQRRVTIAEMPVNHPHYPPGYTEGLFVCLFVYLLFSLGLVFSCEKVSKVP